MNPGPPSLPERLRESARPDSRFCGALILLAVLHAWMASSVSDFHSSTYDELVHLTSGYTYWTTGDFRFHAENGNLPQRWIALPLLGMQVSSASYSHPLWFQGDVWALSRDLFYQQNNDPARMLASGRLMISLLSGCLIGAIGWWARRLWDTAGGLLAATLAAFSPTLLAHGGLATSDTTAALGFILALAAWWHLCHRITVVRVIGAGITAGFLAVSKFSAVLYAPMAAGLLAVRLLRASPLPLQCGCWRRQLQGGHRAIALSAAGGVAAAIAMTTIWAAFNFRYAAASPEQPEATFLQSWDHVLMQSETESTFELADGTPSTLESINLSPSFVSNTASFFRAHQWLPEAYIYGLALVDRYSRSRLAFFAGDYRNTGWLAFFPIAFVTKTTVPAMVLILIGIVSFAHAPRHWREKLYRFSPVLILLLIYGGYSLTSKLAIGHRHLLPLYPALFILAGGAIGVLSPLRRWGGVVIAVAVLAHIVASWQIRPSYLAYFNALIGGPTQAHRIFVDSSLDWGQDLPGLKKWLDENTEPREPVFLSYFGSADPLRHGITATRFGDGYFNYTPSGGIPELTGGTYAISATMLRRVYTTVRGPWTPGFENRYQELSHWLREIAAASDPAARVEEERQILSATSFAQRLQTYEALQLGRLCHYLQARHPDAHIGYSILIYRLTDEEVGTALYAPLGILNAMIADAIH